MIIHNAAAKAQFRPDKMDKSDLALSEHVFAGLNCFEPGQQHQLHTHAGQDKLYFVLEGEGDVTVGSEKSRIQPGDLVLARSGEEHSLSNPGPARLVVLVVMAPAPMKK
jgi:mannose-6-phosphate isomerase-like protein (cupin superfamily)